MSAQGPRPRVRPTFRYALLAVLGVLTGLLVSWVLLPAIFGRRSLVVALAIALLVAGAVLLLRLLRRGRSGQ